MIVIKRRPSALPRLVFLVIVGWMVVVTFGAGVYHLTHGGLGSGPTGIIMSILLVLSAYFITQGSHMKRPGSRSESRRILGTRIILAIAVALMAFSIYHLLTGGWISAVAEVSMALLLLVADYIALTKL
jgi:small-conductance mechanosensitive channel